MQDDDYPAYLKKQSYDDLLSINDRINKESQSERNAMVLAEIAVREKCGEKPALQRQNPAILWLGCFFTFEFVLDLILSRTGWRPIVHLTLGVIGLTAAWFRRKKG